VLHSIWVLWDSRFRDFTRLDIVLVAICGFVGGLIILTSAVFGLIFGITPRVRLIRCGRGGQLKNR
jgi:hypothetical protein